MTNATLQTFRDIAETMIGPADWQWIGPHMSQRMFGITRERAEGYAKAHGGTAQPMKPELTFEQFAKLYRETFAKMASYKLTEIGSDIYCAKLAELSDAHPEWAERVENAND